MHELPITKSIFKTVISRAENAGATAVNRVVLEIGVLRDFVPSIVQKYWDYIAGGSIAEGSVIEIREVDASAVCGQCGQTYRIGRDNIATAHCPMCGCRQGRLVSGSELRIVGIEIVCNKDKTDHGTVQRPSQEN